MASRKDSITVRVGVEIKTRLDHRFGDTRGAMSDYVRELIEADFERRPARLTTGDFDTRISSLENRVEKLEQFRVVAEEKGAYGRAKFGGDQLTEDYDPVPKKKKARSAEAQG